MPEYRSATVDLTLIDDDTLWQADVSLDAEEGTTVHLIAYSVSGWMTTFLPPGVHAKVTLTGDLDEDDDETPEASLVWRLVQAQLAPRGELLAVAEREASVAEVVDVVPAELEDFVLDASEAAIADLAGARAAMADTAVTLSPDDRERAVDDDAAATALDAQLEQARAHVRTWRARRDRQYGTEEPPAWREDADLVFQVGETADRRPAILVIDPRALRDQAQALVAPDGSTGWRRCAAAAPGRAGEHLPVHEVLGLTPPRLHAWVRDRTDRALSATLREVSRTADRALAGEQVADLDALARLAAHASALAAARDAEPFAPGH